MERDEGTNVSIPRGGPIFVPKVMSPLTSIPEFESEMFHELEELKAALGPESPFDASGVEELSADELKVFTDEELICMGMKEAFMEDNHSSKVAESSTLRKESYLEKVEELAKIRQRQKNDRAAARLHSLKHAQLDSLNNRKKDKKCAAVSSDNSERVKSLESLRYPTKIKPTTTREHVSIRGLETILFIEVYSNKNSAQKSQEIIVLGQQKLTALKDTIHCLTDVIMREANQHDPSGYFLIEDVFCNDMRDPSAIDYSKPILDWLKNSKEEALEKWEHILYGELKTNRKALCDEGTKPHLPHFRAFEMQKTQFCNLKFHVGARYLYCHQGDCKHHIVIRDMRKVHPEDCQNRAAYPLVGFQHKFRVQKCTVCQLRKATCFTVDDHLTAENPCYFCNDCYYLLHYDANGGLQYAHVVHKYIHGI